MSFCEFVTVRLSGEMVKTQHARFIFIDMLSRGWKYVNKRWDLRRYELLLDFTRSLVDLEWDDEDDD